MKSVANGMVTQAFMDCLVEGKTPIWLMKITVHGGSILTYSTVSVKVGAYNFLPRVKEFGTLRQSVDEDDPIASPNEFSATIIRDGTGLDSLLSTVTTNGKKYYCIGKKVELWQWFNGLVDADKSSLGIFKITSIEDITQSTFTINCKEDQNYLEEQIPKKFFNKTDFPNLPDTLENEKVPYPIVLGDMTNASQSRMLDGYKPNLVPFYVCNPAIRQFLGYKNDDEGVQSQTIPRAFKLNEEMKMYVELLDFQNFVLFYNQVYIDNMVKFRINLPGVWEPDSGGDARCIRIAPAGESLVDGAGTNNVPTWKDAIDFDESTVAFLNTPQAKTNLVLGFGDMPNIGQYDPGYSTVYAVQVCFQITVITGGGIITPGFYANSVWHDFATKNTIGIHETEVFLPANALNSQTMAIRLVLSGGGATANVDFVHLKIHYWDTEDILGQKAIQPSDASKAPRRRGEFGSHSISINKKDKSYTVNQVFAELLGPSGLGFTDWKSACNHLLFILHYILGLDSSDDMNTVKWGTEVQSNYYHPHNAWDCAISLCRQLSAGELITSLLRENALKMWRDSMGKIRIFCWNSLRSNQSYDTPNFIFSDKTKTPYLISNFKWGLTDQVYNKFSMKYQYDNGKNEYQKAYKKQGSDATLTDSYDAILADSVTAYGEKEYPYPECEWLRHSNIVAMYFEELKRYWVSLKITVEFDTSIVGCLLELGDSIQVDHVADQWVSTTKDFQVINIEHTGGRVHVKAIEIIA